jgi:hypothetical protein
MLELMTQGFVVIPNFLTDQELLVVKDHYNKIYQEFLKDPSLKNAYNLIRVDYDKSLDFLQEKINNCIDIISRTTDIHTNTLDDKIAYIDNSIFGTSGWHQDHGPYYRWKDLYNSLNFWIAIIKPDKKNNGLSVISYDTLSDKLKEKFIGKGAKRFKVMQRTTQVFDDIDNSTFFIPNNIDKIAISPDLSDIDLIILRGDVIHNSQNLVSKRVALSIRSFHKG